MSDYKDNCIFCAIGLHAIKSNIIFEDDDVLAFLDINPVSYGHTLVISKKHYDNFLDCPKDVMHKIMDVAQRIGQVAIVQLGAKGVNILSNVNEAAGQKVKHFHVHVIPRYEAADGFKLTMKSDMKDLNLPAIAETIRKDLN